MTKRLWQVLGGVAGGVGLVAGSYVAYLLATYRRLPDDQTLPVHHRPGATLMQPGREYTVQTFNIGYGSYPPSYSFFMAGGKSSRATSAASVQQAMRGIEATTRQDLPDFALFQEVDSDGDRSRHVNEVAWLTGAFAQTHEAVYGQNYATKYLAYPFTQPIGAAQSGLLTLSTTRIDSARRYSLPIPTDLSKFLDLDRAFTVAQLPTSDGHHLQLVNVHLSAFTKNRAVQAAQLHKLFAYLAAAYRTGDYVVVGGDFNHRLLTNSAAVFHTKQPDYTWTHPFPVADLPAGFTMPLAGLAAAGVPSVRYLDAPYQPGRTFVTLIDGFIVSPNVTVKQVRVVDAGFKDSDHNPVRLTFALQPATEGPHDSTD
ncbi:endonuclease/exonuclease/phosphatase family protein [Lacticaseibacillus nasuensis]|uniref:endonuclease/exonuclease/phosphatase family protein n=1 Tax=Lacticaseibacillus nasuensis TaxID=944671 RepID=UPI002247844C|nr:endonuclease/exonuclease/phosphatase family protein [Lacticaseibacillus nasuensis]MCX2456264.1 endonuclease/exonuclease/phosphatase family protein [Lacticaseibacillus nasuensis]